MSLNKVAYGYRRAGGVHGDVPTSHAVVCYMLDLVGYIADADLRNTSIMEPSCGEGEFVEEIARRLQMSARNFHFNAEDAFKRNVVAMDIDEEKIRICRNRIRRIGISHFDNIILADFLKAGDYKVDIVVGNPPYVRYENLPTETIDYCKKHFTTFHYRCDLYVPFFEKSLSVLKKGGKHCFICSNRWLKNEYGKKLRQFVSKLFCLQFIIDLERADAFKEHVLAYPAITLISAQGSGETFEYAKCDDVLQLQNLQFTHRAMPYGADWTGVFVNSSFDSTLQTIEQQGFKIGIGVATGADSVFISEDLPNEVEKELIIPAIGARDLRGNKLQWQKKFLLNPYTVDGKLINLEMYPNAKRYLESHREKLSKRYIACKSPEYWYKTIDRIVPSLRFQNKILLPDMSGNTFVFIDNGQFYPLHNIYYITGRSANELRIMAALLMSDFVREQLASVTNKMNGGTIRWQSQYLRKLRLPVIMSFSDADVKILLGGYDNNDIDAINRLIPKLIDNEVSNGSFNRKYGSVEMVLPFA